MVRIISFILAMMVSFGVQSQVLDTIFNGYLSPMIDTAGSASTWHFKALFVNEGKTFTGATVSNNAKIIASSGGRCYELDIDSVSYISGLLRGTVTDGSGVLTDLPNYGAILTPTSFRGLYPYVSGLPESIQSCIETRNKLILDTISTSALANVDSSMFATVWSLGDSLSNIRAELNSFNVLDTTVTASSYTVTMGDNQEARVVADVTTNNITVSLPDTDVSLLGKKISISQINSSTKSTLINVNGIGNKILPPGTSVLSANIQLPAGSKAQYDFKLAYDDNSGTYIWEASNPDAVYQETTGLKFFDQVTSDEQRVKVDYEVDSVQAILTLKAPTGMYIYNRQTGATYRVEDAVVSGYNGSSADTAAVVPLANSKYAVIQPKEGRYKLEWFGVQNDTTINYEPEIANALRFHTLTGRQAILEWPPYTVCWGTGSTDKAGAGWFSDYSNINIRGSYPHSEWKLITGDSIWDAWFYASDMDNFTMEGMVINGNKANTTSRDEQTHFLNLSGGGNSNYFIRNCKFVDLRRDMIKILNSDNIHIENCIFDGVQRASVVFQHSCYNIWVTGCTFRNGGDGHIDFEPTSGAGPENVYIENNVFYGFGQGDNAITTGGPSSDRPAKNIYIRGNTFYEGGMNSFKSNPIYIENNVFAPDTAYDTSNSRFLDIRYRGVYYIRNNTFKFPDTSIYAAHQVITCAQQSSSSPSYIEFSGNVVTGLTGLMMETNTCNHVVVRDNKVFGQDSVSIRLVDYENESSFVGQHGLECIGNTVVGYDISNNAISINPRNIEDLKEAVIIDNLFFDSTDAGTNIRFETGVINDVLIRGNTYNNKPLQTSGLIGGRSYYRVDEHTFKGSINPLLSAGDTAVIGDLWIRYTDNTTNSVQRWYWDGTEWRSDPYWEDGTDGDDVTTTKNVGINVSDPDEALEVSGKFIIDDRMSATGGDYHSFEADSSGVSTTSTQVVLYGASSVGEGFYAVVNTPAEDMYMHMKGLTFTVGDGALDSVKALNYIPTYGYFRVNESTFDMSVTPSDEDRWEYNGTDETWKPLAPVRGNLYIDISDPDTITLTDGDTLAHAALLERSVATSGITVTDSSFVYTLTTDGIVSLDANVSLSFAELSSIVEGHWYKNNVVIPGCGFADDIAGANNRIPVSSGCMIDATQNDEFTFKYTANNTGADELVIYSAGFKISRE